MELIDALRTTGAVREFTDEPVPDDVLYRLLDVARFAPNGGNRQAWRVIVVKNPEVRSRLRDLYLENWYAYLAQVSAGLTPWAPVTDRRAEVEALSSAPQLAERAQTGAPGFAERFDEVPVMLAVVADLTKLAAVDRDADHYTLVGGASIYPMAWSILLAARDAGLAGVITTMVVRSQHEARAVLGVPTHCVVAAVLALGHPVHQPTRLRRSPVESFATVDRFDGESFTP
ncbi:MAG: nitroreductase family protein [Acidimicrobiales bacterium]